MDALELALVAALTWAGAAVAWSAASRRLGAGLLLAGAGVLSAAVTLATRSDSSQRSGLGAPVTVLRDSTVGSGACRSCHPSEYASWHRSFHRTMTRLATPESVRGPFDGRKLEADGRTVELSRRGDELWVKLPDPDEVARATRAGESEPARGASLVSRRVVLATGSHHHEVYWVAGGRENELRLVPVTYLLAERRYVPRRDAFLQPPDASPHAVRWNSNCIQCHTTLGRPRHDEALGHFASEAVELGIACEACHGAGGPHVRKHQNPLERYLAHFSSASEPTIVNPARLTPERSSELCGQCHAYFTPNEERRWWSDGFATSYRPGDALEASRTLLSPTDWSSAPGQPRAEADVESIFWSDGTMRVGGRELNSMIASACYQRGHGERQISCLSCHSMHQSDPDDQLRAGSSVDAACGRCHLEVARSASNHTHHAASSPGSSCVGCHMPYTSYALFKGIRSHRIDSPNVESAATTGRPNACNLCHLDRTLAWTQAKLSAWYGMEKSAKPKNDSETALALERLLAGDAADRAIAAWAFGLPAAQEASGTSWQAPFLAELLVDPYSAVRLVASRSLRTLPGFAALDYDFVAPPEQRQAARADALGRFRTRKNARTDPELLLDARGQPDEPRVAAVLARRDTRPVSISE